MLGWDLVFGSITGLLGNSIGGYFKLKNLKLEHEHEHKMIEAETNAMILEANANIQIEKSRIEGEVELSDANAYTESLKSNQKQLFASEWIDKMLRVQGFMRFITIPFASLITFLFALVDILKTLIRPGITIYLATITTYITWYSYQIMQTHGLDVTSNQAVNIFNESINTISYLFISCVTWYFGDRRLSKNLLESKLKNSNL